MNKRKFIQSAAGIVASSTAWTALATVPAVAIDRACLTLGNAGLEAWKKRVGQRFDGDAGAQLVLERVDERGTCAVTTQFTLVFAAAGAASPGIQLLRSPDNQWHTLFLDRAGTHADRRALLRADFCHLV